MKVENLVQHLGLNPRFFENSGMTGTRSIAEEGSLNMRILLYDILIDEGDGLDRHRVERIEWRPNEKALVLVME